MRALDLTGKRFGKLVAIERYGNNYKGRVLWRCVCDCGNQTRSIVSNLTLGIAKSCGCVGREKAAERAGERFYRHGHTRRGNFSSEYKSWASMKARCKYPGIKSYERYGGRGIQVCDRWETFENFLEDMGPKPSPKHSIDRHPDANGNYEPGNCRWASAAEQARNKSTSRILVIDGRERVLADWALESGKNVHTIAKRLKKGWTAKDAVMRPLMKIYKKRCKTSKGSASHETLYET